ncbi:MAG: hypothetical protein PWQ81_554 [Bacteroidota bacterium]|jgi:hypothetical protein|nr:hypothetical protein [Methermicoccus sp.]MDI3505332.1 hypothetical protein [Bacteroidota bacterium]MDK2969899.1 hypothetical protein [Bacteroidota bacterium]MDN5297092.1 hypothetical protein [Bacteroidota bacterium]MDN5306632.1 hypothetical protein [Bacteroidota bacterium]
MAQGYTLHLIILPHHAIVKLERVGTLMKTKIRIEIRVF